MSFLISCPNCGARGVHEFRFGGELTQRPTPDASQGEWSEFIYDRRNVAGVQREWWYHKFGCRKWLLVLRDTVSNNVTQTSWP